MFMRFETLASLIVSVSLFIAGVVHLLPLSGVFGGDRIAALYGFDVSNTNLSILLRHRAVLFGLLGALMIVASFTRTLQAVALIAGLVSVVSFIVIANAEGQYNDAIRRVVQVDWFLLIALIVGAAAYVFVRVRT
jgi:hypothetical protein